MKCKPAENPNHTCETTRPLRRSTASPATWCVRNESRSACPPQTNPRTNPGKRKKTAYRNKNDLALLASSEMPPERTAPNELIGLEEKQRDLIKKLRRRLAQKKSCPTDADFDVTLDREVTPMVRQVTR